MYGPNIAVHIKFCQNCIINSWMELPIIKDPPQEFKEINIQ